MYYHRDIGTTGKCGAAKNAQNERIAFAGATATEQISRRIFANLTQRRSDCDEARQKVAGDDGAMTAVKLPCKCRAGRTFVLTQKLPAQRRSTSETSPRKPQERQKEAKMPNRKRNHSICLKLTDKEYDFWTAKQTASGLSKTDFLIRAITRAEVRIYSIQESIAPLVHEVRKIGTNLNQLAYFSNIGQDERVRAEIGAIRRANDEVMGKISSFLDKPEFKVK